MDYDCIIVAKDGLDCVLRVHKTAMLHEYFAYRFKHLKNQKMFCFPDSVHFTPGKHDILNVLQFLKNVLHILVIKFSHPIFKSSKIVGNI